MVEPLYFEATAIITTPTPTAMPTAMTAADSAEMDDHSFNSIFDDDRKPAAIVLPTNTTTMAASDEESTVHDMNAAVTSAHGEDWYDLPNETLKDINGKLPYRDWAVRTPTAFIWRADCNVDARISRLDVFLQMFPPKQLNTILRATNPILIDRNKKGTTKGEILKFFGLIILATKHEFNNRASLWSASPHSKYESAPNFGRSGMRRVRFDDIMSCKRFAEEPTTQPPNMTSEKCRWLLVDEFVEQFNDHCAANFVPSDMICVDE